MAGISTFGSNPGVVIGPLTTNASRLLHQTAVASTENAKIEKSSKDFESILLSNWLGQAEQSFGSVPGADAEDDADSGKEQFQGIAMQALGASLTSSGGIGIAKMIAESLHKTADAEGTQAAKSQAASSK